MPVLVPVRLLVGLGQPARGDDAVGPLVVARVLARADGALPGLHTVACADPVDLLEEWAGTDLTVVVDAVRTDGVPPGTITVLEPAGGQAPARSPDQAPTWLPQRTGPGNGSSHTLGLAEVLALAVTLDRLPRRLVVVGVHAADFRLGAPPCAAVAAAVDPAAQIVQRLLAGR